MESETEQVERIPLKRFFDIALWVVRFQISIRPVHATIYIIFKTINFTLPILITYLSARLIDVIIDVVQAQGTIYDTLPFVGYLLGANIFQTLTSAVVDYSYSVLDDYSASRSQQMIYEKLIHLGIQSMEDPIIANKIDRVNSTIGNTLNFFRESIYITVTFITFVISLVIVGSAFPALVPLIIIFSLPWVLADAKNRKRGWKIWYETTEGRRKAWSSAHDLSDPKVLGEVMVVNATRFLDEKFMNFMNWFLGRREVVRRGRTMATLLRVFNHLGYYLGYLLIIRRALLGLISIGNIVFYTRLIDRLSEDFTEFASSFSFLYESSVRFESTYELFHLKPAFADGKEKLPSLSTGPSIEIKNLYFTYPNAEKSVLENFSLSVKPGEKLAIVGHNGAGKTTLAKLLSKIYLPTKGKILINNISTVNLHSTSLYQNMSVLFQEYNTYPQLTVLENVAIGKPNAEQNLEEIQSALKKADAWDFVSEYPNGVNQTLSARYKGGTRPSSGQWQKIAIARFFYRNAPFVIFDEPTAAIDAVSEYNIFNKIYEFFEGKTVIIISHRFSTVRNADRIIVMENGKIIEQGTHKELIANDGYYAKSFRLQAEGYSSEPVESIA